MDVVYTARGLVVWLVLAVMLASSSVMAEGAVINYPKDSADYPALGADGQLEVHFINCGPVDCILIRCDGQTMLVDSGLAESKDRILTYLRSIGVDRLDYAFASHPHDDHIGGYPGILAEIPAGEFMLPPLFDSYTSRFYNRLFAAIANGGVPLTIVDDGTAMKLGGARLSFMQWENKDAAVNDKSMVIRVEYGERAVLLAGDVETKGQEALIAAHRDRIRADILKMPHHGLTMFTKEMNAAVGPQLGVSSNGLNVRDTLNAYEQFGVKYYIVVQGTVVAVTQGQRWQVWQTPNKK